MIHHKFIIFGLLCWLFSIESSGAQVLDEFESTQGWHTIAAEGVRIDTAVVQGYSGKCIQFNFNFVTGAGYCGIQKQFPLQLPANFQFSFYLKANAPVNNFEFKLVDQSGDNVWWFNQRNFEFPTEWQKITIKKRKIDFAWGPTQNQELTTIDKIEFVVASTTGGTGTILIDDFRFEPLETPAQEFPDPVVKTVFASEKSQNMVDGDPKTFWHSPSQPAQQEILIDLQVYREYGGLIIDWDKNDFAQQYAVQISNDLKNWETIYSVHRGKSGRSYIYLKDAESRYIKLNLLESSQQKGFCVHEIAVKNYKFSENLNAFFNKIAQDYPKGYYPKYFYDQSSAWTVIGVPGDTKEALINEEGMAEVDKERFSLEPFILNGKKLITWNDVTVQQQLEDDYLPIPSVIWQNHEIQLKITAFADGELDKSVLYLIYELQNRLKKVQTGNFYLAIRPFQVNPPYQFLNSPGGTAKIQSLSWQHERLLVNEEKQIIPVTTPARFSALEFDQGNVVEHLVSQNLPEQISIKDHFRMASGALVFPFKLKPGEKIIYYIAIPFHQYHPTELNSSQQELKGKFILERLQMVKKEWRNKLNVVEIDLPPSAQKLIHTLRSNLAYILINRDNAGIQPGSRSYERSWIRDGALTSSALLKMGIQYEVKEFFDWYGQYQFPSGKIPCVVDHRGPDPVPENDSHGEFIYGIVQYFLFTHDTLFLRNHFEKVQKTVDYLQELIHQRSTDYYKNGNDSLRAFYGLLPESISHEGYSAKPMHSYWDNFWALRGLKDAVTLAEILDDQAAFTKFKNLRDQFRENLYNSLNLVFKLKGIDYLPGCVELGDFDATSTTIALQPGQEKANLPQPYLKNTFDKYYQYFQKRLDANFQWENYTPYELRVIGTFILLDQQERAHELLEFFMNDQRPLAWNQWAEVVWRDKSTPKFIGDMPHTWVGSDYINAIRSFFAYEDENNNSLILGAGLPEEWINAPEGVSLKNLPTYYGSLNYSISKKQNFYELNLSGDLKIPSGKIIFKNFKNQLPKLVRINGQNWLNFSYREIVIEEIPARIEIFY
ncbi:discoidin domain-containing protein [candidate division KSB1 bacterium]|nr:discoidin domain-containing protein [candidate division KSB1 bacterium]